ncbi:FGGY-family carbohydrate kinase [Agrobacterium tumefaciens]|uniref:hypothetical protein n=1 Tax=Agrobacterium tumefaciens TaxID=358 RepID=UPI001ADC8DA1|nr:hypothetical protein [Agrobacterium tumefaciens]QTK80526.1 FGGY-family carbohydrate kinase [Agrobacterium tumefaciens]
MRRHDESLVVGIDIRTFDARAVAMPADFSIVASGAAKLAAFSADHRDPADWRKAVETALRLVLDAVEPGKIRALAADGTSGTKLPVSAVGELLAVPMMYNDANDDNVILAWIARHAPQNSAVHGGTSALAKLRTSQRQSEAFRVIHQADWIMGHFSGLYGVSDGNCALNTGYDPITRCWPGWIAETDADTALLPEILPARTLAASICADAAAAYGLPGNALSVAGTTDGCASFLATGPHRRGDGVSVLGTTLTIMMLSDVPLFVPEYGIYSHRIGDMWLAGAITAGVT